MYFTRTFFDIVKNFLSFFFFFSFSLFFAFFHLFLFFSSFFFFGLCFGVLMVSEPLSSLSVCYF